MNVCELNDIFGDKISKLQPDPDGPVLDAAHLFLRMSLDYCTDAGEPVIGNFEIPGRNIKIDGYYLDEDNQEFHILSLLYFDEPSPEQIVTEEQFEIAKEGVLNFVKQAFQVTSDVPTSSELGEMVQELYDDVSAGYSTVVDFFSNVRFPTDLPTTLIFRSNSMPALYHDAAEISEAIETEDSASHVVLFKKKYGKSLLAVKIASTDDFEVYLTSIPADILASVYRDNRGSLMDGNVRAYLKRTQKVNKGISWTVKNAPTEFSAYNNGLSAAAELAGSNIEGLGQGLYEIRSLSKFQIVNGGQTTVTIYECSKDPVDLSSVVVPAKITVLKRAASEADLVSNIALYANTQTAIAKSDLASNKPFYKTFEICSRRNPCYRSEGHTDKDAYYWFFERANGLYNTKRRIIWNSSKTFDRQFPESKKFSKKLLAKAINAFERKPDIVCLGNEKSFEVFNQIITDNLVVPNDEYFRNAVATIIIWKTADTIIKKLGLPIKAAVLPYTIAYLSQATQQRINLTRIWNDQALSPSLRDAISNVATQISKIFVDGIPEHPNTLMWGRKEDCWSTIKRSVRFDASDLDLSTRAYEFFPADPSSVFINVSDNFNNASLWEHLLLWNDRQMILTPYEQSVAKEIITTIRLSMFVSDGNKKKKGKDIFYKAVKNGFEYQN